MPIKKRGGWVFMTFQDVRFTRLPSFFSKFFPPKSRCEKSSGSCGWNSSTRIRWTHRKDDQPSQSGVHHQGRMKDWCFFDGLVVGLIWWVGCGWLLGPSWVVGLFQTWNLREKHVAIRIQSDGQVNKHVDPQKSCTPPRFNIAPEKWWLEDYFPSSMAYFQGASC